MVVLEIGCRSSSMVCADSEYKSSFTRLYLSSTSGLDVFEGVDGFPSSVPMVSIDVLSLDKKFALRVDIIPFFLGFIRHHRD